MILAPQLEIEPTPPTLEGDVLTPEPPEKSLYIGLVLMLIRCSHGRTFALANLSAYTLIPQRSTCLTSFSYLQYHLLPEKGELL